MTESAPPQSVTIKSTANRAPVDTGASAEGPLSSSNVRKREELLANIRKGRLVVVTGTGVTLQSVGHPSPGTEVAGWPGLLADGLERCRKLTLIDSGDAEIVALQIKRQKSEYLIDAAQKIHNCLDISTNARRYWMNECIGSLTVKDPRLIRAILALNGLVTTLNYDDTIHQVSKRPVLHWQQQKEITELIRDDSKDFILHLHGVCEHLESIVLDRTSYEAICKDEQMQDLLREFARFKTMLFIGCGKTFLDPNFQALLAWARIGLHGFGHRHFVLCRGSEEPNIVTELKPHGYLTPLVYGEQYSELAPFLEDLAIEAWGVVASANPPTLQPSGAAAAAPANALTPADIWKLYSPR